MVSRLPCSNIVSIDPIRFEFTFDEGSFLRYERLGAEGMDKASRQTGIEIAAGTEQMQAALETVAEAEPDRPEEAAESVEQAEEATAPEETPDAIAAEIDAVKAPVEDVELPAEEIAGPGPEPGPGGHFRAERLTDKWIPEGCGVYRYLSAVSDVCN